MRVTCSAPGCIRTVEVSRLQLLKDKSYSLLHGGNFVAFYFCPEHNERITGGRVSDNDPTTNPDLEN